MPNTLTKAGPRQVARAAAPPAVKPLEGIVVGIVAVTGHEDSVQDIIVPGTFTETLRRRRPKLCWMHDWKLPLGRVLSIVEMKPGDRRLPAVLPDGRAWPKEAGALVATMQFNLRTQMGRDYFEHAREWAKNGEAAFSIGYAVKTGMSTKRADGVRMIYGVDLYEVSLVLHGAHNMALALEVKSAEMPFAMETKDTDGLIEIKSAPDFSGHAMVALYPPADVAAHIATDNGLAADELHVTIAYLGKAAEVADPEQLADMLRFTCQRVGHITGQIGGLGMFPAGDEGTPVWAPVDAPGLTQLYSAVTDTLNDNRQTYHSDHGFTPHMTLGYDLPEIAPVPATPVTFTDAYLVVGEQRYKIPLFVPRLEAKAAVNDARISRARLEGKSATVALLEAKSGIPGVADTPSDHAAVQRLRESWSHGKVAAEIGWGTEGDFDKCVALATEHMTSEEAKGWCNLRHHDALGIYPATHAKQLEGKSATPHPEQEIKAMAYMRGSQEERRDTLDRAVNDLLRPKKQDTGDGQDSCGWVSIEATFDDYVVCTVYGEKDDRESFKVPYTWNGDNVALGKADEVELSLVATPEGDEEPAEVEEGDAVQLRFIDPSSLALASAARFVGAVPEGKSLDGLTVPLLELLDALAVKGYNVAKAVLGDEDQPWDEDDKMPNEHDHYSTERKDADPDEDGDQAGDTDGDGDGEASTDAFDPMDEQNAPDSLADGTVDPPADEADADNDLSQEPDGDGDEEDPDAEPVSLDPAEVQKQMDALRA